MGFGSRIDHVRSLIAGKRKGEPEPRELLDLKAAIRRAGRGPPCGRSVSIPTRTPTSSTFPSTRRAASKKASSPTGTSPPSPRCCAKSAPTRSTPRATSPTPRHAPHLHGGRAGRHRGRARRRLAARLPHVWLYRGAWQEWDLGMVDMAVPLSPDEQLMKRHAIYRHLSQKDIVPFPGSDSREFWRRARSARSTRHVSTTSWAWPNIRPIEGLREDVLTRTAPRCGRGLCA